MASYLDGSLQQFSNGAIFRPVSFYDTNNTIGNTYPGNNSSNNTGMLGSILGGAGSLIGSIGNLFGQRAANKTNIAINKMNNEFNERMLEKQMAYNLDMWNKTNEYNTPDAMRARLEAAGFNPYLAISGGGSVAGNAGSTPGAGLASSSGNARVDPVQFDTQGFNTAMQNLSNDRLRNSEADLNEIEAKTSYQRGLSEIARMNAETGNYKAAAAWTNRQNSLYDMTWQNQVDQAAFDAYKTQQEGKFYAAQSALVNSQNKHLQEVLKILPQQLQGELALVISQINLNDANASKALAERFESIARREGIVLNNNIVRSVSEALIDATNTEYRNITAFHNTYTGDQRAMDAMQESGERILNTRENTRYMRTNTNELVPALANYYEMAPWMQLLGYGVDAGMTMITKKPFMRSRPIGFGR